MMLRASKPPRPFYAERRRKTYTISAMAAIGLPQRMKIYSADLPQPHFIAGAGIRVIER